MKKIISILSAFCLCMVIFCLPVSADNNVTDININVVIKANGDASVTQKWKGNFSEGTENYLPIGNLPDGMSIDDFSVWQNGDYFEHIDDWDINASREEKEGKCGVVETNDGVELCFGIGQYGNNTYNFGYTIKGLVGAYTDMDGFNFQFINTKMNFYPTNVKIVLSSENNSVSFVDETCNIWAFGYDGDIRFKKGTIVAKTSSPLDSGERYMNILVGFEKGMFVPDREGKESSFSKVVSTAKKGSSYQGDASNEEDTIGFVVIAALVLLAIAVIAFFVIFRKMQINKFYKACDYFRDVPCKNDMNEAYFWASAFGINENEGSIMAACLLELINNGNLVPQNDVSVGFMGREKKKINLKLAGMPTAHDRPSTKLYNILFKAAGEDGILQEKELEKYSKKNPEELREFINSTKGKGENSLELKNAFCGSHRNIKGLNDIGKKELAEVMGYKKFLLDFSLISERSVDEVKIWENMLVYGALFDVSDKVMDELKKVYPDKILEFQTYDNNLYLAMMYHNVTYRAMISAEQAAANAGSGGTASLGGGGGFSGGGIGGGSR